MTIGIYAESINHFVETLAYFMSLDKDIKVALITNLREEGHSSEHPWSLERLKTIENVEIIPASAPARRLDGLFIRMSSSRFPERAKLNNWLRNSKKIGCLRESHYRGSLKKSVKELVFSFPFYFFANSIVFQDSPLEREPYIFIKNRFFYQPSVHPQFFSNSDWGKKLFGPVETDKERPFKLAFIGAKNPPEREALLKVIKQKLISIKNVVLTDSFPAAGINSGNINVLWIEYESKSPQRGLNPSVYAEALEEADFVIAPPGWGGNWTHRVPEALLRGAIPILEDEKRYNIGLVDMENCVVVKNNDWPRAAEKASNLDNGTIKKMRSNILRLREKCLLPEPAASRLRKALLNK